jgi:hypothetical protein
MWTIVGSPSDAITDTIRQVEDKIPAEDAAIIQRIEFFPGSSRDTDFPIGAGAAAFPWEGLIVINAETNASSTKTLQGTLGHEIGHCIDWRDTTFEWHYWAPDPPLDALATELKDTFAEYFASGYAIKYGFMERDDDWRTPLQVFADKLRQDLQGGLGPHLAAAPQPVAVARVLGECGTFRVRVPAAVVKAARRRAPKKPSAGTATATTPRRRRSAGRRDTGRS